MDRIEEVEEGGNIEYGWSGLKTLKSGTILNMDGQD